MVTTKYCGFAVRIPLRAGEPEPGADECKYRKVYPRACGAFLLSLQQAWGEKDAPDHEAPGVPGGARDAAPGTVRAG